jgi:hypothetical protein
MKKSSGTHFSEKSPKFIAKIKHKPGEKYIVLERKVRTIIILYKNKVSVLQEIVKKKLSEKWSENCWMQKSLMTGLLNV